MPKEPQSSHAYAALSSRPSSTPYPKDTSALAPPATSSTAAAVIERSGAAVVQNGSGSGSGPPRLTTNNVASFRPRVKRLPPDANTKAAVSTQLYQFPERVCFGCIKCKRDNIQSDCVAIDLKNRIMLCTACFTRIIRPRTYTPSRVVPFPSLLSWLNYKPASVMKMSEDVLERPAEAVAPSGERMAAPMLTGGDRATNLGKLPAIAMNMAAAGSGRGGGGHGRRGAPTMDDALAQGAGGGGAGTHATHPCLRVWGVCQHGETCLFRNAPGDLCVAYLMGLCQGLGSPLGSGHGSTNSAGGARGRRGGGGGGGRGGGGRGRGRGRGGRNVHNSGRAHEGNNSYHIHNATLLTCRLLHQEVYDLPSASDPAPKVRYEGDLEDEEGEWAAWVRRHRESMNSAEWQLWHNGPLEHLFRAYVPARRRPLPPKPKSEDVPGVQLVKEGETSKTAAAERDGDEEREGEGEEGDEEREGEGEEGEEDGGEEDGNEEGDDDDADVPPPPEPTKLSLLDIMSALKGMKKEAAPPAEPPTQLDNEEGGNL